MSTTFSSAGAAASTPTSAKDRIPRHTTQEDLATAELLQNFNQQTERLDTNAQRARRQDERLSEGERDSSAEQARVSRSPVPEYHSLDDAASYARNMETSSQSSSEQRFSSSSQPPNAPSTGQICSLLQVHVLAQGWVLLDVSDIAGATSQMAGAPWTLKTPHLINLINPLAGLYFKLHGRHRPSGMKKGEIKRRKRVIPAMSSQAGEDPVMTNEQQSSASPDPPQSHPQQLNLPHHDRPPNTRGQEHLLEPPTSSYGPPPVDFTSYSSSQITQRDPAVVIFPSVNTSSEARNNKKRTLSAANRDMPQPEGSSQAPSTTASSRSPGEAAIDPSLSTYASGSSGSHGQSTNGDTRSETREEKKLRMQRQREAMAAELKRMDEDLQAMEDGD
ncbi:hypothetical protein FKW77_005971 [Venturia effusa]|uniref:Uncharacterized protein n=1 Tax=Venturia effusa TaxID=50376 RepID=A0A517LCD3_9PEZI|nr:hypothetical protein FKW77_005971 [Venturia effusa]